MAQDHPVVRDLRAVAQHGGDGAGAAETRHGERGEGDVRLAGAVGGLHRLLRRAGFVLAGEEHAEAECQDDQPARDADAGERDAEARDDQLPGQQEGEQDRGGVDRGEADLPLALVRRHGPGQRDDQRDRAERVHDRQDAHHDDADIVGGLQQIRHAGCLAIIPHRGKREGGEGAADQPCGDRVPQPARAARRSVASGDGGRCPQPAAGRAGGGAGGLRLLSGPAASLAAAGLRGKGIQRLPL